MTGVLARTCLVPVASLFALLAAALPARADDGVITIQVVPLGPVPADLLDQMARALRLEYGAEVVTTKVVPLPATGPGPRHHRAEALLALLADRLPADPGRGVRVLGVTAADVRATDQDGERSVPGASEQHGHAALVSTFPLRRQHRDRARLADRLSSSAVHHLGHTFGLDHCSEARCAMFDRREPTTSTTAIPPLTHHLGWACRGQLASAAP
jgi:archaemetzincin